MPAATAACRYNAGVSHYEYWIWGTGIFEAIPLMCFALQWYVTGAHVI